MRWSNYKMSNVPATATVIDEQPKPTSMRTVTKQTGVGRFRIDGFSGWGLEVWKISTFDFTKCWVGTAIVMCLSWPGCTERRANLCHQAPSLRPGPKNPAGCLSSFVANKFFALKKHHLVEKLAWVEGHFFLFLLVCLFLDRCPTARRTDWRCQMGNPCVSCRSWCSVNLSAK